MDNAARLAAADVRKRCWALSSLPMCTPSLTTATWPRADPTGKMLNGLPQQLDVITATHAFRPLEKRAHKVMWRGRASDEPRDEVRWGFRGSMLWQTQSVLAEQSVLALLVVKRVLAPAPTPSHSVRYGFVRRRRCSTAAGMAIKSVAHVGANLHQQGVEAHRPPSTL